MPSVTIPSIATLLLMVFLASACTATPSVPLQREQNETIVRWTTCIQKFSNAYKGPLGHIVRRAESHCEGHRRDVIATYPGHLKKRIESLLSERAYKITTAHIIKTTGSESWNASKGTHLDTLRMRLMEARKADL